MYKLASGSFTYYKNLRKLINAEGDCYYVCTALHERWNDMQEVTDSEFVLTRPTIFEGYVDLLDAIYPELEYDYAEEEEDSNWFISKYGIESKRKRIGLIWVPETDMVLVFEKIKMGNEYIGYYQNGKDDSFVYGFCPILPVMWAEPRDVHERLERFKQKQLSTSKVQHVVWREFSEDVVLKYTGEELIMLNKETGKAFVKTYYPYDVNKINFAEYVWMPVPKYDKHD